jgi:signal transduction histidine kinase
LGVLTFGGAGERTYCHQDMEIASQFATHAAIFIQNWQQLEKLKENTTLLDLAAEKLKNSHATLESLVARRTAALRALSLQLLKTQDEERRKVARDLHDSTGQTLIALKMNVANLQKQFVGDRATSDALGEIADIANQAIQEIRTTSYLLHPPLLDELGLASVARWYVDGFAKRSGIQVTLDLPSGSDRLPNDIEMVLFRVLQESLTNVHRHSGASAVDIKLVKGTEAVHLQVHDNGRGMSRNLMDGSWDAKNRSGVGLAGMSERINDLDGRLEIKSNSNGTILRVILPLAGAARPTDSIAFVKDRSPRVFAALQALPLSPLSNPIAQLQARPARRGFSRGRRLAV